MSTEFECQLMIPIIAYSFIGSQYLRTRTSTHVDTSRGCGGSPHYWKGFDPKTKRHAEFVGGNQSKTQKAAWLVGAMAA